MRSMLLVPLMLVALVGCGSDSSEPSAGASTSVAAATTGDGLYPDVVDAVAESTDGEWRFDVTLSSPYDTPERYADAWRIVGPDGVVFGVRELAHDHQNEQPFTRSLSGVEIPVGVTTVTIEGRDQLNGWGGATLTLDLPM